MKDIKIPPIWIITISFSFRGEEEEEKKYKTLLSRRLPFPFLKNSSSIRSRFSIHCLRKDFSHPISRTTLHEKAFIYHQTIELQGPSSLHLHRAFNSFTVVLQHETTTIEFISRLFKLFRAREEKGEEGKKLNALQ